MRWLPYRNIFFDCDSTLTTVEGIDILADMVGKKWRIEVLTNAAMNGEVDLQEVYGKRLKAIYPTHEQIQAIHWAYKKNVVEDAAELIRVLHEQQCNVFIISGGLAEPVREFGYWLGVPQHRIRAVGVRYDALSGNWWNAADAEHKMRYKAYQEGHLTVSNGKAQVVQQLLAELKAEGGDPGRTLLIGDGTSDLLAQTHVDLFVGYGGVVKRDRVLNEAPAFIHSPSLSPLLALVLGPAGVAELHHTSHHVLAEKCRQLIEKGELTIQDERLSQKFQKAYQAIYSRPH